MALVNGKAYVETLCMPCDSHHMLSQAMQCRLIFVVASRVIIFIHIHEPTY